jgi:hypothetical protein
MKKLIYLSMFVGFIALNGFTSGSTVSSTSGSSIRYSTACCKTCKKGKACGDSCISKSYTCHKKKGCACNG